MGIGMDAYEQMGRELFEKSQGAPILLIGMGGVGAVSYTHLTLPTIA